MAAIYCVPLDGFPNTILARIADDIAGIIPRDVQLLPGLDTRECSYDPIRGQHNSTAILQLLIGKVHKKGDRILGVTSVDLFIPIFTFVFGEAQLAGPAAVVSGMRFQNEYYGLKQNAALYHARLLKECLHELGHTFGLRHCESSQCVMNKSTYVENIDLKPDHYCTDCRQVILAD